MSIRRLLPPQMDPNPSFNRVLRYRWTGSGTSNIYRNCLLSLFSAGSAATTSRIFPIDGMRIKRIKIYSLDSTSATHSINILWGSEQGPDKLVNAVGNNTFPAVLDCVPPKNSYAAMWQTDDSSVGGEDDLVFSIFADGTAVECIVDLYFEYVQERATTVAVGVGTINGPGIFYHHLDSLNAAGSAGGTQLCVPVGYTVDVLASRT